jgi:hypothetical protein
MMKTFGTGVATLIAYSYIVDNTSALRIKQDDTADQPEPYVGGLAQTAQNNSGFSSQNSNTALPVTFDNETDQNVELFWLDFQGFERSYGTIAPGASLVMNTYATHPWIAKGL